MNRFTEWLTVRRRVLGWVGVLVGLGVAATYLVYLPEEVSARSGVQEVILRYGHSACWIFLAMGSLLGAWRDDWVAAKRLALVGLGCYVVFLQTLFMA